MSDLDDLFGFDDDPRPDDGREVVTYPSLRVILEADDEDLDDLRSAIVNLPAFPSRLYDYLHSEDASSWFRKTPTGAVIPTPAEWQMLRSLAGDLLCQDDDARYQRVHNRYVHEDRPKLRLVKS